MRTTILEESRRLLERHGFFGQLSQSDLDAVLTHARVEYHRAGELIFAKGSPGRSMMAVLRGSIKISLPSVAGREIVLAVNKAGDIFPETSSARWRFSTAASGPPTRRRSVPDHMKDQ